MTAKHKKSKYDKARDKAYKYYFNKWRGSEKETPAFGQKIKITRSGLDITLRFLDIWEEEKSKLWYDQKLLKDKSIFIQ